MQDCFICNKHQHLSDFTGEHIAERGGFVLSHFPVVDGVKPTKGYLLIETTRHIRDLFEMNSEEATALGGLIKDGTELIRNFMKAEHVYMFRINDKVAHLHIHLIPRYPDTPKEFWGTKITEWTSPHAVSLDEIKNLCKVLKAQLSERL